MDYPTAKSALDGFVGRRVNATIASATGAGIADIGIGYLQAPSQFGEYPRDDEVISYLITEKAEPIREYHYPLWPSVSVHDVLTSKAWTNGARVDCSFSGVTITVELAISDEWRAARAGARGLGL